MRDSAQRSLHTRLTGSFVIILLAGLLLFAAVAVFVTDRNLRSTLDARLQTAANAAAAFTEVSNGSIRIDSDDREQFLSLMGVDTAGVIVNGANRVLLSTASRPPAAITRLRAARPRFITAGSGDAKVRAFALPVFHAGRQIGTVIVWRGSDWIDETDRNAAIAFGIGALLIAALALVAGNVVTRRALEDAFARQRRFTADASHELRAPLAVIRAEADLALRKEREASQYQSSLQTIAGEADRLEALIGDLLSAARAESRQLKLEPVDVSQVARDVCERLMPAAAEKGATITARCSDDAVILADRVSLERALVAIAHNAVKHAAAQGHVLIATRKLANAVDVIIQDDGAGFSREALEHAFERFWRDETGRQHAGTGLGLAIAKSVVGEFGGTIAVSNTGAGAQVRVHFPVK